MQINVRQINIKKMRNTFSWHTHTHKDRHVPKKLPQSRQTSRPVIFDVTGMRTQTR